MAKNPKQIESVHQDTLGFHVPVIMLNPMHKANDDVAMRFNTTKELTSQEFGNLRAFKGQEGWLVFKVNPIKAADIPKERTPDGRKSPAQQLRASLWVWWDQLGKPGPEGMSEAARFELFYIDKMGHLNEYVQSKLVPR